MAPNTTPAKRPKLAAIGTVYRKIMHPQQVIDRFNEGYGWNGQWHIPPVDVVSLFLGLFHVLILDHKSLDVKSFYL